VTVDALADRLTRALEAKQANCPMFVMNRTPLPVARCARLPEGVRSDPDRIREAIDALYLEALAAAGGPAPASWQRGRNGSTYERDYPFEPGPVSVTFDVSNGLLAVLRPGNFPDCVPAASSYPSADDPDIVKPVLDRSTQQHPRYPAEARRKRVRGVAQVQVLIEADGSIGESCVQYEHPVGFGFGDETLRATRDWRYSPATRNGQALAVVMVITTSFDLK
jgi:TonB family protein